MPTKLKNKGRGPWFGGDGYERREACLHYIESWRDVGGSGCDMRHYPCEVVTSTEPGIEKEPILRKKKREVLDPMKYRKPDLAEHDENY